MSSRNGRRARRDFHLTPGNAKQAKGGSPADRFAGAVPPVLKPQQLKAAKAQPDQADRSDQGGAKEEPTGEK